jgi:aspartate kinase
VQPILVQKFGGTSLSDAERLSCCADRAAKASQANRVVVVVSAMGDTTNWLLGLARELSASPDRGALDMLLATGELVSTSLMAIALRERGVEAVPMAGADAGILTDDLHGRARIRSIESTRILDMLDQGIVPVVAGFQGVSSLGRVTTIGRGGSDTSAVAIAAALNAGETGGRCEIYTDVDGIYTADPRIVADARHLETIGVDEMLELASLGAGVLQERAVILARRFNVPLKVMHSQHDGPGTMVLRETPNMERNPVVGCALRTELGRIAIDGLPKGASVQAKLFRGLAEASVMVDDIVQTEDTDQIAVAFTVEHSMLADARTVARETLASLGINDPTVEVEIGLAKLSAVGTGMRSHVGVAARMFEALDSADVPILNITTSEIRISCLVPQDRGEAGLKALHTAFGLSEEEGRAEKGVPATKSTE